MKWLAVILILVVGCGEDRPRVVDPLLLPYVEEFEAAASESFGVDYRVGSSVVFGDVSVLFGGLCYAKDGLVVIPNASRDSSDTALLIAVFHELGHCELGRIEHTDGYLSPDDGVAEVVVPGFGPKKCPVSIMSQRAPIPLCFQANHDYYLAELFGHD